MGSITSTFASVYRDYVTAGVPASGFNDPAKSGIRALGGAIDAAITQLAAAFVADGATAIYATRALLFANLTPAADALGLVYSDGSNNGVYVKVGATGTGSWLATGLMLTGETGADGKSFYEIALETGYVPEGTSESVFVIAVAGEVAQQAVDQISALVTEFEALASDVAVLIPIADDLVTAATTVEYATNIVANAVHYVVKPADTAITSNTTLAADADLVVPLPANAGMRVRGKINYSAGTTGGLKLRFAGPASPTALQINRSAIAHGGSAFSAVAVDTAYSSSDIAITGTAGAGTIDFDGTIFNGSTAGNLTILVAQNASDSNPTTIKAGSYIEYIPTPTTRGFAFANAGIAKMGDYAGPTSSGGHNVITFYQPSGISNSYAETMLTGSTAKAQLFAGSYTITVDGVASAITAPSGWTFVSLFTDLPDARHRVRIKGIAIDSDIAILVTGTAPNVSRPDDIPPYYRIYDPSYASYISKDGALDDFTGLYGSSVGTANTATACGEGHRFSATTTQVAAWLYCTATSSPVELLKDGVSLGVITLPNLGTMERVTLATGLSGTHEYEIRPIYSGDSFYCFAIMVDTLTAAAHANKSLYAWYGDSNVQMQTGEDARTHASFLLAKRRGWANVRRGVGGQSISTWGRDNTALVTSGLSQAAGVILTMLGVNDYYFSVPLATVQADCTTMLANLRAGNAGAPIVVLGIHDHYRAQNDGTPYSNANRVLYNNRLSAAVAARVTAGDANVFYIDTTGWINVTPGVNLRDAVHLNAAGFVAYEASLNTALVAIGL